jgi:HD-GYP domain-containing protein (c-di-GMP phosphodiesterase class II)/PAS domain-containing protein
MKELLSKINSNLKAKIVIFVAGSMVLFLVGSTYNYIRTERQFYIKSVENNLRGLSNTIESSLDDSMGRGQREGLQRSIESIGNNGDISDVRIFNDKNIVLSSSNPAEIGSRIDGYSYGEYRQAAGTFIFNKNSQNKLYFVKPILNRPACYGCHDAKQRVNGVLEVSYSLVKADAEINQHLQQMLISALLICLALVLSVFIALEMLVNRPIMKLRKAMDQAELGEKVELDSANNDELGRLQRKFVQMLDRIRELNLENNRKEHELIRNFEISNSHARLKSMIEAMPDGVSILDRDMVIREMNPRNMEIFPGIQTGSNCYRSIHGRSDPCPHCGVMKVFQDGMVHEHQSSFYLADGKERIVHSISAPVRDVEGNITHAVEVIRDITDKLKTEKAKIEMEQRHQKELEAVNLQLVKRVKEVEDANNQIALLIKDLAQKNTELEKVVERLTTVNHIGNILNSLIDQKNALEVIVRTMAKTMNARICSLMLVNEDTNELEVAHSVGLEGVKLRKVKLGEGISGYAAKEGKPLLVTNIETDPRFNLPNDPQYSTTSLIAAPLFIKGKVIGILNINNKKNGDVFTHDDLSLLTTVAGQAAIAVENSNLYRDIRSSYFDTVRALVNALEAKDKYSKGHSERVTLLAMMIADEMGLSKEGKLTGSEYDVIKDHPLIGEKILDPITFLKEAKVIVGQHHERYDGKGYPHQRMGSELSIESKILAVADTFDALTSDRPYRKALPFEEAVAEIRRCSSSQFDPEVVDVFLKTLGVSALSN